MVFACSSRDCGILILIIFMLGFLPFLLYPQTRQRFLFNRFWICLPRTKGRGRRGNLTLLDPCWSCSMVWTLFEVWLLDHRGTLSFGEYVQPDDKVCKKSHVLMLFDKRTRSSPSCEDQSQHQQGASQDDMVVVGT